MVADGVRIWEIFSRKSSLNDLALRAILVPRKLPLWPDGDGVAGTATPDDTDAGVDDVLLTTAPGARIGSEWHNDRRLSQIHIAQADTRCTHEQCNRSGLLFALHWL